MERTNRNTWLNSFVKITSGNAKTENDPIYIVYRQQNGWCTLHQLGNKDDVKIVKMNELRRVKIMHICVPIAEVDRILKVLEKGTPVWLKHSGESSVWDLASKIYASTNEYDIVHIINNKYSDNLYFTCRDFYAIPAKENRPACYGVSLTKLLYKSEKIIRN